MEPKQNRNKDDLHPDFRDRLEEWLEAAKKAGYEILVYETFRTPERQKWLFEAGRSRSPYGRYLTYTMDSCHRYGLAADLVALKQGTADWDGYGELYKDVPPSDYGLETLDFERPHLQIVGGQKYAKDHQIARDIVVGSLKRTAPANDRIPLYDPLSNKQIGFVSLIKRQDGTYKAYRC